MITPVAIDLALLPHQRPGSCLRFTESHLGDVAHWVLHRETGTGPYIQIFGKLKEVIDRILARKAVICAC